MPTYAVLGGTGTTGQALLRLLLQSPKNTVNAYVRSKAKLHKLSPQYKDNDSLQVFEGAITDVSVFADCISNVSAVFCVLGANENLPGVRIVQDAAHSIVAACCQLRAQDPTVSLPKILFLTSASINPHLCRDLPKPAHWLLLTALSYTYEDLRYAEDYLRLHKSWLNVTFIQPGGLVQDTQRGHALNLDRQQTFLSYMDLAAGMIEAATVDGDQYKWKGVSVVPTKDGTKIEWRVPFYMAQGLLAHYLPSVFWVGRSLNLI